MNTPCLPASGRSTSRLTHGILAAVVLAAVSLPAGVASAATYTWNDTGGTVNQYFKAQNWVGDGTLTGNNGPGATDNVIFGNLAYSGGGCSLQATSGTVLSLTYATGTTFTFSGNAGTTYSLITGTLSRQATSSGTQTISVPIILGTNAASALSPTWTIDGSGALVVSGAISGTNAATSLTKSGTGVLELSGANTFGGALTVTSGTLRIGTINNAGTAGVTGTSTSNAANFVLGGATLEYTGTNGSTDRSFTLSNATTSTINVTTATTNLTFSGSSAATTGALTKIGAGTLTLAGAGNYSGATTVNAGTLALGANSAISNASAVTVNAAAFNVGLFSDTIASLTTSGNTTLAFSGSAATAGSLTLGSLTLGAGTDTLSVTFSTAPTQPRYNLITYTSRSGTFDTATITGVTGYRLVYGSTGSGTVALAQSANQTFVPTSGTTRALVGSTFTVTGTLTNTSLTTAYAPLDVSLSGTSSTGNFLGFVPAQGSTVAGGSTSSLVTGTLTALAAAGTQNWSMVNTDTLATTTTATASGVAQVVNNRTYTTGSIALARFLSGAAGTGTAAITTTGLFATTASGTIGTFTNSVGNGLTLSLASGTNGFNGSAATQSGTYTTGGAYAGSLGAVSGSFTATATNEFGGTSGVNVAYTGTAVTNRTYSPTAIAFGRFLSTAAPSGTATITSTGLSGTTASGTIGAFATSNGLTLSLASGTNGFDGSVASQSGTYTTSSLYTGALGGFSGSFAATATNEFGGTSGVSVAYSGTAVANRTYTPTSIAFGRFLNTTAPSGTATITSTGLSGTTASGTIGAFATSNGLTLSLASGTNGFDGGAASQSGTYTTSSLYSGALGGFSGSFAATATNEFSGTSGVSVSYSGTAVVDRTYSPTAIAFGRFLNATNPSGTSTLTSTGLSGTTASGTVGGFTNSAGNGLTLSLSSGTNGFNGSAATQSGTYTTGGSYAGSLGAVSSSFTATGTNEFGGTTPVAVAYSGTAVDQRSFSVTSGTVALGRYLINGSLPTGTTGVSSSGLYAVTASGSLGGFSSSNGLTLSLTSGSANFAGASATQNAGYTVSGSATSAGLLAGSFSSTVSAELGSISPVVVNYTANPVNQRSFSVSAGTVALGRFLISGGLPSGTTGISSSGLFATTASGTLGDFSSSNGLTLSLTSGSASFAGASAAQTAGYAVSGSATSAGSLTGSFSSTVAAEFGSISPVVVNYTANPVYQRVFTTSTSAIDLGFAHQGSAFSSATLTVTSTGLNATTASGTLAAFTGGPAGLSMSLTSGSARFTGAAATQSTVYTLSGSATLGSFSGTFTSAVSAELGSIPSLTLAVTGQVYSGTSIWATNGGGSWGTFAGTGTNAFGVNWQANQGSPGLDAAFSDTDTATFGSALTSGPAAIYLDGANPSLKSLTFDNANSYSIYASAGGSRITLSGPAGALVSTLSGTHAIHSELTLASAAAFNVSAGAMFELHGTLSGSGAVTKSGAGTLEIYGNNDFIGDTSITAGTVFVESGTAPFGLSSNLVSISGGALLNLNGMNVPNTISIVGSGTVINAYNPVYETMISGTGQITSGTGSEIQGQYTVLSGGFGTFVGTMAATATINGGGRATFANNLAGAALVNVAASGTALFSGTQGGEVATYGSSTFAGSVTDTVNVYAGSAAFNGPTTVGSTVNVSGGVAAYAGSVGGIAHVTSASGTATFAGPIASSASVEFTNGGVGRLLEGASVSAATILNNGMIYVERTTNLVAPTAITGMGGLTNLLSGTFIMSGASTYTGATTISAGAVQIGNGGTTGSLSPNSSIQNDGTLVFNRSDAISQGTHFSSGAIVGTGGLTQAGSGVVALTAINTYSGVTAITSGTLSAAEVFSSQNGSNIGKAPNSAVQLANQGTLLYTGSSNTYTRGFSLSDGGGKLLVAQAGITLQVNQRDITGSGTFTVGGDGNTSIDAVLRHTGGLRYTGSGTLTLRGNNTYTGMTYLDSGMTVVGISNSQGSIASSVTVASGAMLAGVGSIAGTIAGSGTVSPGLSPGVLTAASFDPSTGMLTAFEFTRKNLPPTYNNPGNIQNDVLHLTGSTPIVSALYAANIVDVYMSLDAIPTQPGDFLEGGFFADGITAAALYDYVKNATFVGWVATDGPGERTFNGVNYVPLTSLSDYTGLRLETKYYDSQNFGGGNVAGSVTEFIVVPEPGGITTAVIGMIAGSLFLRRKRPARRAPTPEPIVAVD